MIIATLVAAALSVPAFAGEGFESSMKDLRDSLRSSARAVGAKVLKRPLAAPLRMAQGAHGRRSGDPCLENKALDGLKLRWSFEPEAAAFYIKLPKVEVDFSGGRCEPYYPPPEAHHGDTPQAIRRYSGSKDYDLVLVTDLGAEGTGVVLLTKSGMIAVSYGEFPAERLATEALELPKLPVAKSLTESVKGKAALAPLGRTHP